MSVILDHIVLNVKNLDASVEFYRSILGFSIERLEDFQNGKVPFPSARIKDDTLIDLFPPKMWQKEETDGKYPNLNHFCIAMSFEEWQALREKLQSNNIELHRDKTVNFGAKGEGISMYFFDPDGNEIEARYYPE